MPSAVLWGQGLATPLGLFYVAGLMGIVKHTALQDLAITQSAPKFTNLLLSHLMLVLNLMGIGGVMMGFYINNLANADHSWCKAIVCY